VLRAAEYFRKLALNSPDQLIELILLGVLQIPQLAEAVDAFGEVQTEAAEKALIGLLSNPKMLIRELAVRALARFHTEAALTALRRASVEDDSPRVREAATAAVS
jgi:HEAT repeat protein